MTDKMVSSLIQNPHLDSSPFFLPGGSTGVLLIHGFTATPVEVRLLGEYLHKYGYTVSGPLLPGHGATVEELNRCTWRDWVEHVRQTHLDLSARCTQVFVGGESMGGLLALYLGSKYPSIAGVMAFAPALRAASRLIQLSPLLKFLVKTRARKNEDTDSLVNQRWQGYSVIPVPASAQLLALQRQVRRRLPHITQPLLIIQGRRDTTLDTRGAEEVLVKVDSHDRALLWLEKSSHCLLLDAEWETAAKRTLAFLRRIEKKG
jgi:carboxylesterase